MHRIAVALLLGIALAPAASEAQPAAWNDGSPSRLQHRCILGIDLVDTIEDLTWTWVGFRGLPVTNQVYYMRIVVGGLGCSGAWVRPEVKLPRATAFAVSGANPIRCFYQSASAQSPSQLTDGSCPAQPILGLYPSSSSFPNPGGSGYSNSFFALPPATQPYWPLPPGATLTIEFPVISTQVLSGIASNDYLLGAVNVLDNNPGGAASDWDGHAFAYNGFGLPSPGAWQGVFVSAGAYTAPRIAYPEPSSANVTQNTADTLAYVYNASCVQPNRVAFDLFLEDTVTDPPGAMFASGGCTLLGDGGSSCHASWSGLQPDTTYAFRAYFLPFDITGCPAITQDSGWKFFHTPPPPGATRYALLATADGNGTVQLSPGGGSYAPATLVTATAVPSGGASFSHWSLDTGGTSTTNPLQLAVNAPRSVVAHFVPEPGAAGAVATAFAALAALARRRGRRS